MTTNGRFSERHGHGPDHAPITIRADAPQEIRQVLLDLAEGELGLRPRFLRSILCAAFRRMADPSNWTEYPNIWLECRKLMEETPWYRVYDFVELLYERLASSPDADKADRWERVVNEYFIEAGVGWRMVDGVLEARGPEAVQLVVDAAREALAGKKTQTANKELREAFRDLSRRPTPDLTGAVQHAMAGLECTARDTVGDPRATLGEIIKRHPDLLPKPLDEALTRMWGYASEAGRHLREGREPNRAEAELMVGTAAIVCNYLRSKLESDV